MTQRAAILKRITEYRNQKQISLEEMADECGVDKVTLGKVGSETYSPTLGTLQHIAAWMGITVSQLVKIEPETVFYVVKDDACGKFPYGVRGSFGEKDKVIMDLFSNLEEAEKFVSLCNFGLLAFEQLEDVAADWVQKQNS